MRNLNDLKSWQEKDVGLKQGGIIYVKTFIMNNNKILFFFLCFLFPLIAGAQLSGNYTINPAGLPAPPNYTSFGAAVTALTSQGVSGHVVFTVSPNTYTETFTITNIPGTGPGATVTFQSNSGPDNCIISFNAPAGGIAQGTVNLRGAKYVSFKGITIQNFQATANSAALHIFAGDGSGTYDVRAEYLSFDNCRFIVDTTLTTARFGVFIANNSSWNGYTRPVLAHKVSFTKCLFKGGTVGLGVLPSGTSNWYDNPVDSVSVDSCEAVLQYSFGAELWGCKNVSVTNSRFHRLRTGNGTASALRLYQSLEFNVRSNYIICGHRIGLEVNQSGSPVTLGTSYAVNNYISGGASNACAYLSGSRNVRYYHNTFSALGAGGVGVDFNAGIVGNEFVNNIVEAGTNSNVNVFNSPNTVGGFTALDYNVYYGANGGTARFYWGTNHTGLPAWQTAEPLFNVNSVFGATVFAPGSPEITDPATARPGTNLGITTDIFGRLRGTAPTIGAYEYASQPVLPQPGPFIVKTDTVCNPPVNDIRYTINAVTGATGYEWRYTGSTVVNINGVGAGNTFTGGSNDTTVLVNFGAGATTGMLIVNATNAGVLSPDRSTPVVVQTTPSQPGGFTASAAVVCQGQNNVTYTVPNVPGVIYNWTYTGGTGATINGSGNSVTVSFSTSATNGTLEVTATSSCGTSPARTVLVTVNPLPAQPGTFTTSSANVCAGQTGVVYMVPNVANTTYNWSYTGTGATINGSGNGVYVDFNTTATNGVLSVTASNTCGTSARSRDISVTVNQLPHVTVHPASPAETCIGDTVTLTAGAGSGYSYQWKNASGVVVGNGSVYDAYITGTYKVVVTTAASCKDSSGPVPVKVHPLPQAHLEPGDTAFCAGGVITLYVVSPDTALSYIWKNGTATIPLATADFLEITTSGVYTVVVNRAGMTGCTDTTPPVTVTASSLPMPVIDWDGMLLHATPGYTAYQWRTGGQPVAGATDSVYQPAVNGTYTVTVMDTIGCSNTSAAVVAEHVSIDPGTVSGNDVHVFPNPASHLVYINARSDIWVTLSGMDGKVLYHRAYTGAMDISALPDGIYLLRIATPGGLLLKYERLVKATRY